jgi:hypothetical protein
MLDHPEFHSCNAPDSIPEEKLIGKFRVNHLIINAGKWLPHKFKYLF